MGTYSISSMKNYRGIIETLRGLVVMIVASDATGPGFRIPAKLLFLFRKQSTFEIKDMLCN